MPTTVREARIRAASIALDKALPETVTAGCLRYAAECVVDTLFTDRSMDHLTVRSAAEREAAEYLPGD